MLDSKFRKIKDYFGISTPADWCDVEPGSILALDGIGQVTLDHIRIYLAARNLTLKNDRTADHWKEHLSHVKIGHEMGDEDTARVAPFTIFIDSAETQPFTFQGIPNDRDSAGTYRDQFGDKHQRAFVVPTEWRSLGRYPNSLGDYSIDGGVGRCHVERKSLEDLHGTLLGFARHDDGASRRERFESELANLSKIEAAMVVVEADFADVVRYAPEWGKRTQQQNAKTLARTIIAYQQDFPAVSWMFAGSRRMAEMVTYRWFARWWDKQAGSRKEMERLVASM